MLRRARLPACSRWGTVATHTDCHDFNAAIHPGASELGNGTGDNCNGQIDEPVIVSLIPLAGERGTAVTLGGMNFGAAPGPSAILVNGVPPRPSPGARRRWRSPAGRGRRVPGGDSAEVLLPGQQALRRARPSARLPGASWVGLSGLSLVWRVAAVVVAGIAKRTER